MANIGISIPSLRWGKRKERTQMCESFTEDGRIVSREMDVMRTCMDDSEMGMGFLLDAGNQYLDENGDWVQVLWERTCFPVCMVNPGKDASLDTLLQQISKESRESKEDEQLKKASDNERSKRTMMIVGMICGSFIAVAGIVWLGG